MRVAQGHIVTLQMNQQLSSFLETTCCSTPLSFCRCAYLRSGSLAGLQHTSFGPVVAGG